MMKIPIEYIPPPSHYSGFSKENLREIPLKDGDTFEFKWCTRKLGRAGFMICSTLKDELLFRFEIYPIYQENCEYYYSWEGMKNKLNLLSGLFLNHCKLSSIKWCEEHKIYSYSFYVPTGSKYLQFWDTETTEIIWLYFKRTKQNNFIINILSKIYLFFHGIYMDINLISLSDKTSVNE